MFIVMRVTPVEKADFITNQFKGVAQVSFKQWKEERVFYEGPLDCNKVAIHISSLTLI